MAERFFTMKIWPAGTALASGGTLESAVIDLSNCDIEYLELKLTPASGNAGAKIEQKFSSDGVTFNEYTDQDSITDSTLVDYAATPNDAHHYLVPRHRFVKLRLTEIASKTTTVTGTLECSEF